MRLITKIRVSVRDTPNPDPYLKLSLTHRVTLSVYVKLTVRSVLTLTLGLRLGLVDVS